MTYSEIGLEFLCDRSGRIYQVSYNGSACEDEMEILEDGEWVRFYDSSLFIDGIINTDGSMKHIRKLRINQ